MALAAAAGFAATGGHRRRFGGGGLTIATLVNLRDKKLGLPACAVAISPWVDLEATATASRRSAQDPMVQKDGLLWMAKMYLNGKDPETPLAAPLHADLKGLPPTLVQVGTAETLLDDAIRIAEKMHAAGVDARLAIWPNQLHVFPLFAPILSEGRDGCIEIGTFIRSKTAYRSTPMPLTGGDAIVDSLLRHGIDTIFGLPGVQMYGLFDAFARNANRLKVINARSRPPPTWRWATRSRPASLRPSPSCRDPA